MNAKNETTKKTATLDDSIEPTPKPADAELPSRASEVARRQSAGTWKYVVDHPYAGADLSSQ